MYWPYIYPRNGKNNLIIKGLDGMDGCFIAFLFALESRGVLNSATAQNLVQCQKCGYKNADSMPALGAIRK